MAGGRAECPLAMLSFVSFWNSPAEICRQLALSAVDKIKKPFMEDEANDSIVLGYEPIGPISKRGGQATVGS